MVARLRAGALLWLLVAGSLALAGARGAGLLDAGPFGGGGHTHADLLAEVSAVAPGVPFTAAVRLKMDPTWHTYWVNYGDAGTATKVEWNLPAGWQAGPIQWPTPQKLPLGEFMNYGYEDTAMLLVTLSPPADVPPGGTVKLAAKVTWLECSDAECVQGGSEISLELPVVAGSPALAESAKAQFDAARAALPRSSDKFNVTAWRQGSKLFLGLEPAAGATEELKTVYFFSEDSQTKPSAAQVLHRTPHGWVLEMARTDFAPAGARALPGVLEINGSREGVAISPALDTAPPAAFIGAIPGVAESGSGLSLMAILGLGFLGGLILNVMPCVFPVLAIKVLGLVKQAGGDRAGVVRHGLVFTAGVLMSMWVLVGVLQSLRAAGAQLGWGFQLQEPAFVLGLAIFFVLFALSLSGVFEIGGSLIGAGTGLMARHGLAGSFFQGGLAVVVATPCTAPLLAPALGAAIALPAGEAFLAFTAIALGLASPYLLLSLFPGLARFLPRPGAWMETFKQAMAFPLYATAGFLLYTLAGQVSAERFLNILFALVAVALAAWFYGRYATAAASPPQRRVGQLGGLLLLVAGLALAYWPIADLNWEPWSSARVAELQKQGRPIYVDFTARWCATCQVNKDVVFHSTDRVRQAFERQKVALLRADWTSSDPAITDELARFGRSSVPFDLLYLPGKDEPVILPSVLTPDIVLDALGGNAGGPEKN